MAKIGNLQNLRRALIASVVFALSAWAQTQTTVSATVSPNPAVVGESVKLIVSAQAETAIEIDSVKLPQLRGFTLVRGSEGQSSQAIFTNGQIKTTVSRVYGLTVDRQGDLVIDPIHLVVDGEALTTQEIQVKVLPPGARPQRKQQATGNVFDEEDEADQVFSQLLQRQGLGSGFQAQPVNPKEAYHVLVEVDKTKAYVNEQVTASWYLATRGLIREFDPLKYPQLKGFWKEDIEIATSLNFQNEVINGMPYKKALLMRSALFPIKPGPTTIDPYKTKATVIVGGGSLGGFGFGQPYVFNKASQEIKIQVLPLPNEGKPNDFTGAVGQFQLTSVVNTSNVVAHQPFEYKLRIQGQGNAKGIDLPPLNLPASIELYDQKADSKFNPDGTSHKDFVLYLVPRESGTITVPAITMSYFDPKTATYIRKSAPEVKVQVREGSGAPQPTVHEGGQSEKSVSSGKPKPSASALALTLAWREPRSELDYWPLWLATYSLVAIFLILSARRLGFFGKIDKKEQLKKQLHGRFKELRALTKKGDWRQVGAQGTNLLYFVLGQLSEQGGAQFELDRMLEKIPPSLRLEFKDKIEGLLRELEILTFAPESYSESQRSTEHLNTVTGELEKVLSRAIDMFSGA